MVTLVVKACHPVSSLDLVSLLLVYQQDKEAPGPNSAGKHVFLLTWACCC